MAPRARLRQLLLVLPALLLTACGATPSGTPVDTPGSSSTPQATATPTVELSASPTPAASSLPTPTPAPSDDPGPVIVTFRVADEQDYRALLTQADDIAIARALLAGEEAPRIPNGAVVRDGDGGVNTGYSWHIDPNDIQFADLTTEICDGMPSMVAGDPVSYRRFCPWSAVVVAIDPYDG